MFLNVVTWWARMYLLVHNVGGWSSLHYSAVAMRAIASSQCWINNRLRKNVLLIYNINEGFSHNICFADLQYL
jgi:hypothetical protein